LREKTSSSLSALGGAGAGAGAGAGGGGGGGGAGAAGGAGGGGGGGGGNFFAQAVTVNVTNKTIVVNHTYRRKFIVTLRISTFKRVELSVRSIPCQ